MATVADELINNSLDDVIVLLEREIERLQLSLETIRLSNHPDRSELIRWHIRTLDERQDALEQMKALLLAAPATSACRLVRSPPRVSTTIRDRLWHDIRPTRCSGDLACSRLTTSDRSSVGPYRSRSTSSWIDPRTNLCGDRGGVSF